MTERACEIPNCPALAARGRKTCDPHRDARTAEELRLAKDFTGKGGKHCQRCRRKFAKEDYVNRAPVARKNVGKHADQFGYVHVSCEPAAPRVSKKALRESEKPLLEAFTDDVAADRGAA